MKQLTPNQADAAIRASWPRPYPETLPIDYALHTAECGGTVGSEEDAPAPASRLNGWLAVVLVAACAAVVVMLNGSPL